MPKIQTFFVHGMGKGGGCFLAEEKVATRKMMEDGQGVFRMLSFIPFKSQAILPSIAREQHYLDVLPSSVISQIIFILLFCDKSWRRENTCSNIQRLHCWGRACYKKAYLCVNFTHYRRNQDLLNTYYMLVFSWATSFNSSLADAHIPILCNFPKATLLSGARCMKSSYRSKLLGIILFCLAFCLK